MYQNLVVVGHLGENPKMKYTKEGNPVTEFSMATTRKWKDKDGGAQEKTTWFRVNVWGKQAETCNQFLKSGSLVLVEGEVDVSAWADKEGKPKASLEVKASNVRFLSTDGKKSESIPF